MLRAAGLSTFPNYLDKSPEGSQLEAKNIIIDRDGVIEPRRGIKVLGETYDIPKQLLTFKNRILVHSNDVLQFSDGNDPAIFTSFKGKKDFSPLAVDILTDTITINLHQLSDNDMVIFSTTGVLPAPLTPGVPYFVQNTTQNTFQLSLTEDGLIIDLTTQGTGVQTINYDYVFKELEAGLRVKYIELNGNLYVTTINGIKAITTNSEYAVTDAGVAKALDLELELDLSTTIGFLKDQHETAYRVVWGTKDINDNLKLGVPSYRQVIQNYTGEARNVFITFSVPEGITTDYFYQVYRSNVAVIDGSGDELNLVYEAPYTGGTTITVLDEQLEDIRDNGTPLYSNEFSGEGAFQTNNPPPIAKDISIYRNSAFYANIIGINKTNFTLVGLDALQPGANIVSITGAFPATVTTAIDNQLLNGDRILIEGAGDISGKYTATNVTPTTFEIDANSADYNPTSVDTPILYVAHIKIEKNAVINEYFFVGLKELYQVVYKDKASINPSSYFLINSADAKIKYCFWYDTTGTDPEPSLVLAEGPDRVFVRIDISDVGIVTATDVAVASAAVINATGDFLATASGVTDFIGTANAGSGALTGYPSGQNGSAGLEGLTSIVLDRIGMGEDPAKLYVRKSELLSPAAAIQDTAQSLVKVINLNTNEGVYAYYTATITDLPGAVELESRTKDAVPFTVTAYQLRADNTNTPLTAAMFNPDLRTTQTSVSESNPNKLFFSKVQQPEAVPLVNSITIGPKDKAILRIIGLRDSLFILKEEGIYRLTGDNPSNFSVSLFDNSATILAADTTCVLNNQVYCLTTQGVVSINEAGVGVISRPIEDKFLRITSPAFTQYKTQSFAFSYESDRSYLIFIPKTPTDTYATQGFRYNTFTQSWTEWDKAGTSGVVETSQNRLYLGAGDIAACEIERKDLTSRDYADRQYDRNINVYDDGFLYMDNTLDIVPGDMLTQTQYVTMEQVNSLLTKIKLDPTITINYNPVLAGQDVYLWLQGLYNELNTQDSSRQTLTFDPSAAFDSILDKITITNHGFVEGDLVRFSSGLIDIDPDVDYYVKNATTDDFQLALTASGPAILLATQVSTSSTVSNNYAFTADTFAELQTAYNKNIDRMNVSGGLFFTDYRYSTGSVYYDLLVTVVQQNQTRVMVQDISPFFTGPVIHYKAIKSSVIWNYMDFGDPSLSKHVREGVTLLENTALASATIGYATDLSGNFEDIQFSLDGDGGWGDSIFQNVAWGGMGIAVPMRTYIPRQKQRCRYIKARFQHNNAFYKFSILGIAYTFEINSERAWR